MLTPNQAGSSRAISGEMEPPVVRALYKRLLNAARGLSNAKLRDSVERTVRRRFRQGASLDNPSPAEVKRRCEVAACTERFLTRAGRFREHERSIAENTVEQYLVRGVASRDSRSCVMAACLTVQSVRDRIESYSSSNAPLRPENVIPNQALLAMDRMIESLKVHQKVDVRVLSRTSWPWLAARQALQRRAGNSNVPPSNVKKTVT